MYKLIMMTVPTGAAVLTELVDLVFDMHADLRSFQLIIVLTQQRGMGCGIYSGDVGCLKRLREEISGQ